MVNYPLPTAYEGTEPYIFVSYAHKNSDKVLPIITAMQNAGFRIWFDHGIEAGTEWPEYIEEHLENCSKMLIFMSDAAVSSINCRNEINLGLALKKEILVVYLEETTLRHGLRLQLGSVQSMFACRSESAAVFEEELFRAKILQSCRGTETVIAPEETPKASEGLHFLTDDDILYYVAMGTCTDTDVVIPAKHDGKTITEVFYMGFRCKPIKSVFIANGITRIGPGAFEGCTDLTRVSLPGSITDIACGAFESCTSLPSITLPEGVTSIEKAAFMGCTALTSINIPSSVTSIGDGVFASCTSLTHIEISPKNAFFRLHNGNLYSKDMKTLVCYVPASGEASFVIPSTVTCIQGSAFEQSGLTAITIPSSVESIGEAAFYECEALKDVTIQNGATSIGSHAFCFCESLKHVSLPSTLTSIGTSAFSDCSALKSIRIPDAVAWISEEAFNSCSSLQSVSIPKSVTAIEDNAFAFCDSLRDIYYSGSTQDWNRIDIAESGFECCPLITVHCIDGNITI